MELATVSGPLGLQPVSHDRQRVLNSDSVVVSIGGVMVCNFHEAASEVTQNPIGATQSGFYRVLRSGVTPANTVRWGIAACRPISYGSTIAAGATGFMAFAGRHQLSVNGASTADVLPNNPVFLMTGIQRAGCDTSIGVVVTTKVVGILLETHSGGGNQDVWVLFDGVNGFGSLTTTS